MAKSLGKKSKRLSQEHIDAIFELFSKQIKGPQAVYHQLDVVRKLCQIVQKEGVGGRYLIQHSAGSGKSNSIAWLACALVGLSKQEKVIFDSVLVITDRIILDRQLQDIIEAFCPIKGVVGAIEEKIPLKEDKDTYFLELLEQIRPQIGFIKGQSIKVGYEILFNQHFYRPTEAKSARTIQQEIRELEGEIQELLDEILA
ncbi:hypothetical protein HSHS1_09660 [Helicobacter suis HS1]|nr:hypothetical protein HSHS1_09660 [Helicobacter suis HS1]